MVLSVANQLGNLPTVIKNQFLKEIQKKITEDKIKPYAPT
jgi:hypothetical protein